MRAIPICDFTTALGASSVRKCPPWALTLLPWGSVIHAARPRALRADG